MSRYEHVETFRDEEGDGFMMNHTSEQVVFLAPYNRSGEAAREEFARSNQSSTKIVGGYLVEDEEYRMVTPRWANN